MAVFSYTADLPKGSKLLPGAVSRQVFDGWQFQGVSTFATGASIERQLLRRATASISPAAASLLRYRADRQRRFATRPKNEIDNWFNTSVFKRPSGRGDLGNNCNNAKFTLPGFNNHDLSLFKKFNLKSEKRTLEFRWETFNTFNHTQFSAVGTTANFAADGTQTNTSFGKVTARVTDER